MSESADTEFCHHGLADLIIVINFLPEWDFKIQNC